MVDTDARQQQVTQQIEDLLVSRNLRGMKQIQAVLPPGYFQRAAEKLYRCRGTVLIGTGFPVVNTFETDGPVGAMAMYRTFQYLGMHPVIVCGDPLASALGADFELHTITVGDLSKGQAEAQAALAHYRPELVISIERPGLSAAGRYNNMRGEDISTRCACFDYFMREATCPTIAIGDGGNEIGMGNVQEALKSLNIIPSVTGCDELLVADVSNWGAYGLIALLGYWRGEDLLALINPLSLLRYTSGKGSVDGVTRQNTLTEDSLAVGAAEQLIESLRRITGFL
ncbi:MAG: DUF4392 domain-containing protein [Thiothrix sp.]|nr:DUF4392 domain-containing protein [Thiothrix sp.]HPE60979.1 DUF4392 domain-containing protein [Thiolinea sp.]